MIEKTLYASRWILAPIYLGLTIAIAALGIKFFTELYHLLIHLNEIPETDLILVTLALVDMTLVSGLILMVMFSGYENFVSKIDIDDQSQISWLSKLDANTLKLKVAASIVAISSIHLLKIFMKIPEIPNEKLLWYTVIHLTFVLSALLMGILDKVSFVKTSAK